MNSDIFVVPDDGQLNLLIGGILRQKRQLRLYDVN